MRDNVSGNSRCRRRMRRQGDFAATRRDAGPLQEAVAEWTRWVRLCRPSMQALQEPGHLPASGKQLTLCADAVRPQRRERAPACFPRLSVARSRRAAAKCRVARSSLEGCPTSQHVLDIIVGCLMSTERIKHTSRLLFTRQKRRLVPDRSTFQELLQIKLYAEALADVR